MPLAYRIDQASRIIFATASGILTDEDLFAHQREVWSRGDVAGFDEIFDLGAVDDLVLSRVRALADLAAIMEAPEALSRLAIVAPQDFAYGLARMYATYRTLRPHAGKAAQVFRSMQAALDWLGSADPGAPPGEGSPGPGSGG